MIARFDERVDEDTVRITLQGKGNIPESGWVRSDEDGGTGPQLDRQERAMVLLRAQPLLIESLREPFSFDLGRGRWIDPLTADDEVKFDPESQKIIERMLGTHPLYALQGPPGSGKSTLTAAAVQRNLNVEQGARILVSSQSNHTLDGLARKLILQQGPRTLILRETPSNRQDEVQDPLVRAHTLDHLTAAVKDATTKLLKARLNRGSFEAPPYAAAPYDNETVQLAHRWGIDLPLLPPLEDQQRELAEQWLAHVESDQLELSDRIRSGASVVLASCSIAATINDGRWNPKDLFDWVIVEEAAKAWSTEIIVPLVLGVRWTLIGDHLQLGPHRGGGVGGVPGIPARPPRSPDGSGVRREGLASEGLAAVPAYFRGQTEADYQAPDSAVGRLEKQFRMDRAIAEPISRAFYPRADRTQDENGLPVSFLETRLVAPLASAAPTGDVGCDSGGNRYECGVTYSNAVGPVTIRWTINGGSDGRERVQLLALQDRGQPLRRGLRADLGCDRRPGRAGARTEVGQQR